MMKSKYKFSLEKCDSIGFKLFLNFHLLLQVLSQKLQACKKAP